MFPQLTVSPRKSIRLLYVSLAIIALLILASPGSAAGPQRSTGATDSPGSPAQPDASCPPGGQCFADVPSGNPFYDFVNRIYQQDLVAGYPCGGPGEPCDPDNRPYYRPADTVTRQQMAKFIDGARRLPGIHIEVVTGTVPIYAQSESTMAIYAQTGNATAISGVSTGGDDSVGVFGESPDGKGVYGGSSSGNGLYGISTSGIGVQGDSNSGLGVFGFSNTGIGVDGRSSTQAGVYGSSDTGDGVKGESPNGKGVYGISPGGVGVQGNSTDGIGLLGFSVSGIGVDGHSDSQAAVYGSSNTGDGLAGISESGNGVYGQSTSGLAGSFDGDVSVTGNCCEAAAGTYRIDDPTDPANRYLYHSAVQSPDMMDIYNGNITTDAKGEAQVVMPSYFQPLNRDFRYQLTTIGQFAQAMVSSEIRNSTFTIKTDKAYVKVSWQVTGIRQDAYANAHRTPVQQDKRADERGKYLHPTELGQPANTGINYGKQQEAQSKP